MKMTKYLSLLLGILPTAPLCAQWELNEADGYRLIVVTDRPDALYARGDEICFIVTLEKDGAPVFGSQVSLVTHHATRSPLTGAPSFSSVTMKQISSTRAYKASGRSVTTISR